MKPTLITLVKRLHREKPLWPRGAHLLCACSGGPDSTAALHVLAGLGLTLTAVGVDHGLRAEARAELEGAAELAQRLGVAFETRTVHIEPGPNLQARAREARHAALQAAAKRISADAIVLGHTADDRAETVLIRLLRGSGARGLAVMPPRAPGLEGGVPLARPLLLARRADVLAHLERHRLTWSEDPSNEDRKYLRSRIRHEVLPLLDQLDPGVVDHLNRLASELGDEVFGPGDDPWSGMTRGQRDALAHAIRAGRSGIKVRLGAGRDVELRFSKAGSDSEELPKH